MRSSTRSVNGCFVLTTVPELRTGKAICRELLASRWIACGSLIPIAASLYRWEGKLCAAKEVLLLLKTRQDLIPGLFESLKKLHPYQVPEIVSLPMSRAHSPYLKWLQQSTRFSQERQKKSRKKK